MRKTMQSLALCGFLIGNGVNAKEIKFFFPDDVTQDIQKMQQEMNQLISRLHKKFIAEDKVVGFSDATIKAPAIDIIDKKENYLIRADIPGANQKSIKVTQKDGILSIEATTVKENQEKDDTYIRKERFVGHFVKMLTLPKDADTSKFKTNYKDGVLEIIIPKR